MILKFRYAAAGVAVVVALAASSYAIGKASVLPISPGANYIAQRQYVLASQARGVEPGRVLIIGDSIAERSPLTSFCGQPIFNAGVSSIRVEEVINHAQKMRSMTKPAVVVFSIGVNDAMTGLATPNTLWEKHYRQLVSSAACARTILMEIMPTGKNAEGEFPRDNADIREKNKIITRIAQDTASMVIEAPATIDTLDGVHLTPAGYRTWMAGMNDACAKQPASNETLG